MTQPLKWHGGKHYLAKRIIALMVPHIRYVEPFFGGGAVLFQKPCDGVAEFVNDIDRQLINFWSILADTGAFSEFHRIAESTPLSKEIWTNCNLPNMARPKDQDEAVASAFGFFVRFRQSRQGLGKDYCTPTKRLRRGMNENVSAWLSTVDGLPEAYERLRRVEIWNIDSLECIQKLDSPDTLFYCDPPYLRATRSTGGGEYHHEMTEDDHENLLYCLSGIQGKFLLSGYPNLLYDKIAYEEAWHCVEIEIDNKASSKKRKEIKTERLWMNYEPSP